jgi:CDP-diacylglycerol--glycerol-3-phosphate 3-phosphatidyltransferase
MNVAAASMNLPNLLTVIRFLMVPVFVLAYVLPLSWGHLLAAAIFALAGFTDWLDGYLARRLDQTTSFGAVFDPVADKLIVAAALVLLTADHANLWLTLPAVVIVGRELAISGLREWMAEINRRGEVKVSWLGKLKTSFQFISIVLLLANHPPVRGDLFTDFPDLYSVWLLIAYSMIYTAAVLTLWSMALYIRAAWPALTSGFKSG